MSDPYYEHILDDPEARRAAEKFFTSTPVPEGDLQDLLFEAQLDAADRFAPDGVPRVHDYTVHLTGPNIKRGVLTKSIASSIVPRIITEVTTSGEIDGASLTLGVTSIAPGSVVLRFQPLGTSNGFSEPTPDQLQVPVTEMDRAIKRIEHLHSLIEKETPSEQIRGEFSSGDKRALLHASGALIQSLDEENINLSSYWRDSTGHRTSSRITERGRDYARQIFTSKEAAPAEEEYEGRIRARLPGAALPDPGGGGQTRHHPPQSSQGGEGHTRAEAGDGVPHRR